MQYASEICIYVYFIVLFIYFDKFNFYVVALFMFLTSERRTRNLDWEMLEKFNCTQCISSSTLAI